MRQVRIKIIVAALLICCIWFVACNSHSANNDNKELQELEKVLGVKFPADAKIVYSDKSDRSNETCHYYIIHTQQPVLFHGLKVLKMPAESSVEVLKNAIGARKLGKLKDKYTYTYEGSHKSGGWTAFQTNFETGSYLKVEQTYF